MWSVALTDTFQMVIIIVGLSLIAVFAADQAGGAGRVIEYAQTRDMFQFFPTAACASGCSGPARRSRS